MNRSKAEGHQGPKIEPLLSEYFKKRVINPHYNADSNVRIYRKIIERIITECSTP